MNLKLSGLNFTRNLPELQEGYEWAKDDGCHEGGMYPRRRLERTPESDNFERTSRKEECPQGYHEYYTYDNRRIFVPNDKI